MKKTKIIAISSGKGGVGKSQIAANLAYILSQNGYKCALVEISDLPSLDIIINAKSTLNLSNFLSGECEFEDIFNEIKPNLFFIATGGSEFDKFGDESFAKEFFSNFNESVIFDFLIVDMADGNSQSVLNCMKLADENIVVTLREPAAISDAYSMIKLGAKFKDDFLFIVNFVKNEEEAVLIFENLKKVAKNNIKTPLNLNLLGFIKKSSIVPICAQKRSLVCEEFEYNDLSIQLQQIASRLLCKLGFKGLDIKKLKGIKAFLNKLSNLV